MEDVLKQNMPQQPWLWPLVFANPHSLFPSLFRSGNMREGHLFFPLNPAFHMNVLLFTS